MPQTETVKVYVKTNERDQKIELVDKPTGIPVRFKHELPDGSAKQACLEQQLTSLLENYPSLATGRSYLKITGRIQPKTDNDQSVLEVTWDKNFRYEMHLKYREESTDDTQQMLQDYRIDCHYMRPDMKTFDIICNRDPKHPKIIGKDNTRACLTCEYYKSRHIKLPITISAISTKAFEPVYMRTPGMPVKIRPANDENTYLGIYIGDLPIACYTSFQSKTHVLTNKPMTNPAFFVYDLGKIVFGMESWWTPIDMDDPKACDLSITDSDIENQPYIKLLNDLYKNQPKTGE